MSNSDLLRLGFRAEDGTAQPGQLDENNNIKVSDQTLYEELQLVKAELQEIKANQVSGQQKAKIPGMIAEYMWFSTEDPPVLGPDDRAFGVEMDLSTHKMVIKYWTGTNWHDKA